MNRELALQVREFIGLPPKFVSFTTIRKAFPKYSVQEIEDVLDFLWECKLVEFQFRAREWVSGRKPEVMLKMSKDDLDWMLGIGQYKVENEKAEARP